MERYRFSCAWVGEGVRVQARDSVRGAATAKTASRREGRGWAEEGDATYADTALPAAGAVLIAQGADDLIVGVGDGKGRGQGRSWRHLVEATMRRGTTDGRDGGRGASERARWAKVRRRLIGSAGVVEHRKLTRFVAEAIRTSSSGKTKGREKQSRGRVKATRKQASELGIRLAVTRAGFENKEQMRRSRERSGFLELEPVWARLSKG